MTLVLMCAQIAMVLLYFFQELGIMKIKILNLTKKFLEYNSRKEKKTQVNFPPKKLREIKNNNRLKINSNNDILISNAYKNKNNNNFEVKSNNIEINNKLIDSRKKDDKENEEEEKKENKNEKNTKRKSKRKKNKENSTCSCVCTIY